LIDSTPCLFFPACSISDCRRKDWKVKPPNFFFLPPYLLFYAGSSSSKEQDLGPPPPSPSFTTNVLLIFEYYLCTFADVNLLSINIFKTGGTWDRSDAKEGLSLIFRSL
jgi:hypothetical protein